MIHRILILTTVVATIVTAGCSRRRTASPHPWPVINGIVDTLSQKLDYAIYRHVNIDSIGLWAADIHQQAQLHPGDEELALRARYYNAMNTRLAVDDATGDSIIKEMLGEVDSAAHPYLYNRLAWLIDDDVVRDVAAFDRIAGRLEYFRRAGDDFVTAAHYTLLGNLLKNIRDPRAAVAAYRSADSLYMLSGAEDMATFNRMNMASALTLERDTVAAVALLNELRGNSYVKSRAYVEEMVLEKLFEWAKDTTALDRLCELQGDHPGSLTLLGLAERAMNSGEFERAVELSEQALDAAIEEGEPDFAAISIYTMGDASAAAGDTAGAYTLLRDAIDLTDQIALANEPDEISALETMRAISMRRMEAELARSKATLKYVCVGFVLFLLLVIAAWIVTARMQWLKRQRMNVARERDSVARRLIATQVARSESERLISTVGKEIGGLADDGRISSGETRRIVNAIKSHAVKQGDRETFIETFGSMHPEFTQKLRDINSAFTESDIRLASYLAMGLDTKHIADTMGVRPESVKQARWRLRSKMGLDKGASLEDALRALLD